MDISRKRLRDILFKLKDQAILVIGDLMWDEYIRGDSYRISPEAPVPVVLVQKEEMVPGGATNVLRNLLSLKCQAGIGGVVGEDLAGQKMEEALQELGARDKLLIKAKDRPTILKTRIIARNQQMLRVDRELVKPLPLDLEQRFISLVVNALSNYQALILSDYDKGVLSVRVIQELLAKAKEKGIFVAVDPQVRHFRYYAGSHVMTPNEKEAAEGIGAAIPQSDEETIAIGQRILQELQLDHLIITRSHKGMALFVPGEEAILVPTVAREVYDVTGAGDTVIAVYTAALLAGASRMEAVVLANAAAGIVVGKLGTATTTVEEISEYLEFMPLVD
ncbi:MAG: D-glycero-beta-D-manno-heptose-7-phosphate kinase [Leptospiraceae bacterium]|nr:D-glycero-beta-D-manno-heptose-7-phosphate kinase [Leptospiraceae bacterium]MDW8306597.1 D-glycero-beta-D-manno-heptose-7-phosphate kinase [Leptospiraceae bacterium]